QSSRTWFALSFQNGVSQLHSTRVLQTMSSFILFSICETYCTLSLTVYQNSSLLAGIKNGQAISRLPLAGDLFGFAVCCSVIEKDSASVPQSLSHFEKRLDK
ncbi:MAG TPA: hypothetical protein H9666_09380, partial [Firmicutes bacterium]|nr:hypothetical protein [Bacillota bacterium]